MAVSKRRVKKHVVKKKATKKRKKPVVVFCTDQPLYVPAERHGVAALRQLAENPDLEGFQIVCHWQDGRITSAVRGDVKVVNAVRGAELLKRTAKSTKGGML